MKRSDESRDPVAPVHRGRPDVLSDVLQQLPIGVLIVDAQMRVRQANAVADRVFGVDSRGRELNFAELLSRLWPRAYADYVFTRFEHTLRTGEPYRHTEHSAQRPEGDSDDRYAWEIRRLQVEDDQSAVVCTLWDITDRVATQRELERERAAVRQQKERLNLAQSAAGLGIFDWYVGDTAAEISPEWRRMYGLAQDSPVPNFEQWAALIHPEDRERTVATVRAAACSLEPYHDEYRVVWPDGSVHWIESSGKTLTDPDGRPVRLFGTVMDISERKAAEQQIAENEKRFRLAVQIAPLNMFEVDLQLRCTWVYRPAFDFTELAVIGKRDDELMSVEEAAPFIAFKQHVLDTGRTERRLLHVSVAGVAKIFDTTLEPLRDADGKIYGLIGASLDITDLANAKAAAEAANRAKDDFLAVLSHELRTPLAPVLANSILLERDPSLSSGQRKMMSTIRRNVELEARLIDDLLDATRISRNKVSLHKTRINAHQSLTEVLDVCRADAEAKGLAVTVDLRASLHTVYADPARFQQILWNLLKNAIKFTPQGGHITIRTANPTERCLRIAVADTGIGIAAEALPHIFGAFQQGGDAVTQRFGGLGLGLAISQSLAQLHDGKIVADSAGEGAGALFTFDLPTCESGQPAVVEQPTAPPRALNCRILLVEDNADTRDVFEMALSDLGCTVAVASTFAEAVTAAEGEPFDLLITDIGLPDGSGLSLMRDLRNRHDRLRGIVLSGFGREQDLTKSRELGFDAHLVKPVTVELLEQTVQEIAGRVRWSSL